MTCCKSIDYMMCEMPCHWLLSVHSSNGYLLRSLRYRKQCADRPQHGHRGSSEHQGCALYVKVALLPCRVEIAIHGNQLADLCHRKRVMMPDVLCKGTGDSDHLSDESMLKQHEGRPQNFSSSFIGGRLVHVIRRVGR